MRQTGRGAGGYDSDASRRVGGAVETHGAWTYGAGGLNRRSTATERYLLAETVEWRHSHGVIAGLAGVTVLEVGEAVREKSSPAPVNATVCGLPGRLSEMLREADCGPAV